MLSRIKSRLRRFHSLVALLAFMALWAGASGRYECLIPGRMHRLVCAVNSHAGFAHMTRGMNTYTIDALDAAAAEEEDIPVLEQMLSSDDHVVMMTAAEVLQKRGKKGHDALMRAFEQAKGAKDMIRAGDINEYGGLKQKIY